jgi:hypothetical protein
MISHSRILSMRSLRKFTVGAILAGVSVAYCDNDPRVQTIALDAGRVTEIPVCAGFVTTVLFPWPVSGIVGYGLTSDPGSEEGTVQYAHPADSGLVTLRVLKADLRVAYMTVMAGDQLYDFTLQNDPAQAALSVRLTDGQRSPGVPAQTPVSPVNEATAQVSPPAERVLTKQDVVNDRPVYHPEKLRTLLQLAKEAPLLQPTSPDLYQGYEERKVQNISDYGDVIATVEEVHRFPADDAIVLFGEIQNKSAHAVTIDPGAITIGIGDRQYPSAFVDCTSRIDPGARVQFGVIGQGDVDSGRAHLALGNPFRVLLPGLRESPAGSPSPTPAHRLLAATEAARRRQVTAYNRGKAHVSPSPSPAAKGFVWPWQHAQLSPSPSPKPTR